MNNHRHHHRDHHQVDWEFDQPQPIKMTEELRQQLEGGERLNISFVDHDSAEFEPFLKTTENGEDKVTVVIIAIIMIIVIFIRCQERSTWSGLAQCCLRNTGAGHIRSPSSTLVCSTLYYTISIGANTLAIGPINS